MRLEDLLAPTQTVKTSVGDIDVEGIGAGDIAGLLVRFPALQSAANGEDVDLIGLLTGVASEALPIVIAMGCGMPGKKGEAKARKLGASNQVKVIRKIAELTFPEGLEAFVAEIEALAPADLQEPMVPGNFAMAQPDTPDVMPVSMLTL